MKMRSWAAVALVAAAVAASVVAQEREDRTLLTNDEMRAIVNEASGERAMHHVLELVPYPRVRPLSEYQGHFRESDVMARFAKDYGFSNIEIESFPTEQKLWQPTQGELWMTTPEVEKLFDIYDVPVSLAANSASGDVTAELIDAGTGARAEDFAGKEVKGKIVLGSAGANQLQRLAVFERGAVGVISYTSLRPDDYPDELASSAIAASGPLGQPSGFAWVVSPRVGRDLAARLARGQKVTLRSTIKAETFPGELETVHATIPGDGSTDQEVIVSAHLYEGYIKQGANDDNSGCALTLEMGRAYLQLVKDGKLPKPKRTIHFLWVPEISGTNAWLNAHKDVEKHVIADLNFDMEALRLSASRSFWVLHRTPDTFPSFLNDIGQSFLEWAGNVTRERVRYRTLGYGASLPITAPNGSRDPLYYVVDKHYGASDHVTYMQHGIPALMFITWPDMWYHSSQDTPEKQDPTQYKRAAVVGIGALSTLASARDQMAARVAAESLSRGAERMGAAERKGLSYLTDAADPTGLSAGYKDALVTIRHQAAIEKAVMRSAAVLFDNPAEGQKRLSAYEPLIDQHAAALTAEVKSTFAQAAALRNVQPAEPAPTDLEREASRLVAERLPAPPGRGAGGGFGGGFGQGQPVVPQHMLAELNILTGQNTTVLEIRDFLSGEFEPLPLADLMSFLRDMEKAGRVKLTLKPEPAPPKKKGRG